MGLAPSSAANFDNYYELQVLRIDAPFFLSGRPASAKVYCQHNVHLSER